MLYNITTFKNVFPHQMAKFNNANPQLLLQECMLAHAFALVNSPVLAIWDLRVTEYGQATNGHFT